MNSLEKLQATFQENVINNSNDSTEWISAKGRASPSVQLSVYNNAYRARLHEVLESDFPAMAAAIGDESFEILTSNYLSQYPSHYFSLRDYGHQMPRLILDLIHSGELDNEMLWLHELSVFEWALGDSFDAADANIFTEQDMASIQPEAWPTLIFKLHPSVQRLDLQWNAPEMWLALTEDEPKEVEAIQEDNTAWLLWRNDFVTQFRSMQRDEQIAFDTLKEGKNFNDVCESLSELMDAESIPMHAAGLLKMWINQGLITSIEQ